MADSHDMGTQPGFDPDPPGPPPLDRAHPESEPSDQPLLQKDHAGLDVEMALKQADLFRVRGELIAATSKCLAVLKADPENVHAHVLLGDLHVELDEHSEALHWYRTAIGLDPDRLPTREKLSRLLGRADLDSGEAAAESGPESLLATPDLPWKKRALPLGITALAGMVLILTTYVLGQRNRAAQPDSLGSETTSLQPALPSESAAPQVAPPAPGDPAPPASAEPTAAAPPSPAAPEPSRSTQSAPVWTATESQLLGAMRVELAAREDHGFALYGATFDPTVGTLILTFESPVSAPDSASRAQVVARAREVALLAVQELPEASILTLRAANATRDQLALVFVGVTTRAALQGRDPKATFVPEWWASD